MHHPLGVNKVRAQGYYPSDSFCTFFFFTAGTGMGGIIFSYIVWIYEIEYPDYCYSFNILCIDAFFK